MKRYGKLYELICNIPNINLADGNARKDKFNWGIVKHDKHKEADNQKILENLLNHALSTSAYSQFTIHEPKERIISRLPYYPDRIVHWAIMLILEPIWTKTFISHTYSCIKGRGIHRVWKDLRNTLKDKEATKYCLKLDIRKFYPSINHDILKNIIRRKIKDNDLLIKLDEIIDSAEGIPIGNYLSQFFANLYLTYFDHWLKEVIKVKHYFRYADDMVLLSDNKTQLHEYLDLIRDYLRNNLQLKLKGNYQIFPVEDRGIDFVGYKFYHTHTLIRKSIKKKIFNLIHKYKANKINKAQLEKSMSSYFGWLKYCDSKHLLQKIEQETGLHYSNWRGKRVNISSFYNETITVYGLRKRKRNYDIHFTYNKKPYVTTSESKSLYEFLSNKTFPIKFKLYEHTSKI